MWLVGKQVGNGQTDMEIFCGQGGDKKGRCAVSWLTGRRWTGRCGVSWWTDRRWSGRCVVSCA